jgi:hypothetical protein
MDAHMSIIIVVDLQSASDAEERTQPKTMYYSLAPHIQKTESVSP